MNDSEYAFPTILQSILLVVVWLLLVHPLGSILFSFAENESLISLLTYLLDSVVLLLFVQFLVRNEYVNGSLFIFRKVSITVVLLMCLVCLCIKFLPHPWVSFFDEQTVNKLIIAPMAGEVNGYHFLMSCIVAPIFEEILFRGIILDGLIKRYSFIVALLVSSVLFCLLHVSIVDAFLFSCFVGWIYYRSGNLFYCIVAHAVGNAISFSFKYAFVKNYVNMEAVAAYTERNAVFLYTASITILLISLFAIAMVLKKIRDQKEAA